MTDSHSASVLVVGGGFAGIGCATDLAKHDVDVTLVDRYNVQQFLPLLYQVATAELAVVDETYSADYLATSWARTETMPSSTRTVLSSTGDESDEGAEPGDSTT